MGWPEARGDWEGLRWWLSGCCALTILLVVGVAGLAFVVSFEAISAFAVATGAFPPALGWCAPLLVDAFTAAATLVVWSRSLAGLGARDAHTLVAAATAVLVCV